MSKRNYQFGGNVRDTVPASRQNIEQRTPSGVRPVASPVTPVKSDVEGDMKHGGELKMNKPKKMAFGGPAGRMAPGGFKTGAPVNQRTPAVMPQYGGPAPNMAPGAGGMPMAGGFGGSAGPGGFSMDGRANQLARGAMPQYGGRVPGMKKGGMASASSYEDMTGGAGGGVGRLEKSSIAAKTKSQKLKKGGKVKGYYEGGDINKSSSGGDYLSDADRLAAKKAGIDPNSLNNSALSSYTPDRSIAMAEYRARQDAAEKRASKPAPKPKAKAKPEVPGGPLPMPPTDFSRPKSNPSKTAKEPSFLERMFKVPTREEQDAAYKAVNESGMFADKMYPRSGRLGDGMKKGGKAMKMAKGGKAEKFEGSAKDMAQDKKMAKARGMTMKEWEASSADVKHDTKEGMKKGGHVKGCQCMACGGGVKRMASGGMSTAQDGMKGALRPKPSAMAKGGVVGMTFGKPLPGTKVSSQKIRSTVSTNGANMKKDGMKGQLRAKASGAKTSSMMKPLGMTKMAGGGKVRGTGIAQRGTKFIGEV
jgi:hypothetical protein